MVADKYNFKGKVAVVTGGNGGIGRSVALEMARRGADVVVAGRDNARLEEVRREIESIGRRGLAVHCDVSKDSDVDNLAAQSISTMGKVDVLFNNAGVAVRSRVENINMKDWEWIVNINLLGYIRCVHAFLPPMLKRGNGYIINMSSANGLMASEPPPFAQEQIAYSVTKFGIVGFTEGIYSYLRPKGIMVSVICPGMIRTHLAQSARFIGDKEEIQKSKETDPLLIKELPPEQAKIFEILEPDEAAKRIINSVEEKEFFIFPHKSFLGHLTERGQDYQKLEKYLQDTFGR